MTGIRFAFEFTTRYTCVTHHHDKKEFMMATPTARLEPAVTETEESSEPSPFEKLPEDLREKAQSMNIKPFVPQETPGVYDDQVNTLIAVDEQTGISNTIEVLVPTNDVLKHKRYFSQSAAKRDKTSIIVNGEKGKDQGDGGSILEFRLVPKRHRNTAPTQTQSEDTPQAVPAT